MDEETTVNEAAVDEETTANEAAVNEAAVNEAESASGGNRRRPGRETFRRAEAPLLGTTAMMSMPVMSPEAPEQFIEWVTGGGQIVKVLFGDPEGGGTSLLWSWFGPGYVLPRHSHSADCLYYVARGELRMGNTVLTEGDGFFQPADRPYTYTAGPDGVEVLEFRTSSPFDMRISESRPGWERILEVVRARGGRWAAEKP